MQMSSLQLNSALLSCLDERISSLLAVYPDHEVLGVWVPDVSYSSDHFNLKNNVLFEQQFWLANHSVDIVVRLVFAKNKL